LPACRGWNPGTDLGLGGDKDLSWFHQTHFVLIGSGRCWYRVWIWGHSRNLPLDTPWRSKSCSSLPLSQGPVCKFAKIPWKFMSMMKPSWLFMGYALLLQIGQNRKS
jgi:hypothetical protein